MEILIDQRAVAITKVDSAVALILIGSGVRFCETFRFYTMLSVYNRKSTYSSPKPGFSPLVI